MLGGEITVRLPNIFELTICRIKYLNVTCDISISVDFTELVECFIRNVGDVKLMVAYNTIRIM